MFNKAKVAEWEECIAGAEGTIACDFGQIRLSEAQWDIDDVAASARRWLVFPRE
jgi:hypothetical protein